MIQALEVAISNHPNPLKSAIKRRVTCTDFSVGLLTEARFELKITHHAEDWTPLSKKDEPDRFDTIKASRQRRRNLDGTTPLRYSTEPNEQGELVTTQEWLGAIDELDFFEAMANQYLAQDPNFERMLQFLFAQEVAHHDSIGTFNELYGI